MNRVFVIGSCVTRDAFGERSAACGLELDAYVARTSLASAFGSQPMVGVALEAIESSFQRRQVDIDVNKRLESLLRESTADAIVFDPIDERFDLLEAPDGALCTLSNELLSSGFDLELDAGRRIASGSDAFFQHWVVGWQRLVELLSDLGALHRLRVNRVRWSSRREDGGDFLPFYQAARIEAANCFLERLYQRMSDDLSAAQFISVAPELQVGAVKHRWGPSPFHYVDGFYASLVENIVRSLAAKPVTGVTPTHGTQTDSKMSAVDRQEPASGNSLAMSSAPASQTPFALDRQLDDWLTFDPALAEASGRQRRLETTMLSTRGSTRAAGVAVETLFEGGAGAYEVRLRSSEPFIGNGVGARLRVRGWKALRYVAIGYTHEGKFRHIKAVNAAREQWIDLAFGHNDLIYGWQNDWQAPPATPITDIRIHLNGEPGDGGAWLDIEQLRCWREADAPPAWLARWQRDAAPSRALLELVHGYHRKCLEGAERQVRRFMDEGLCPLYGGVSMRWESSDPLPAELSTVGTYRFSWHALHPAAYMLVHAHETGDISALFAAREFLTNWLERSCFQPDADRKFAWYDHGTAERLLCMVRMWMVGIEQRFDHRFMSRLRSVMFRHAQLLASEAFYASHQPTRYHNHAWFQDVALMAAALALPDFPCARQWLDTALARLTDQLDRLVVRDGGHAVFVENSIGYHNGVQRLVDFAGALAQLAGHESVIPAVAQELVAFSKFLRYPGDGRAPAQGDTFRRGNAADRAIRPQRAVDRPGAAILAEAGYAVMKGNHDGIPFMLSVFATSLSRTHKHEDNLSFTLFFDGIEWLIDPSFYSHEYAAPLPAYLRSAAAHNCLALPGREYSIQPGLAQLSGTCDADSFSLEGIHRAYSNVLIERELRGRLDRLALDVVDRATATTSQAGGDDLRLLFHCGEGVKAALDGRTLTLRHPHSAHVIELRLPGGAARSWQGHETESLIRGVTGLGFMQQAAICTIECSVPFGVPLEWSLRAEAAHRDSPSLRPDHSTVAAETT